MSHNFKKSDHCKPKRCCKPDPCKCDHCCKPDHCNPDHCKTKHNCEPIVITAKQINKASRSSNAGFIICEPGIYYLCDDVEWKTKNSNSYAITIIGQNITLDLRGHFIKQINTFASQNFLIHVANIAQYVTIRNGTLIQGSGGAILGNASDTTYEYITAIRNAYNGPTPLSGFNIVTLQPDIWGAAFLLYGDQFPKYIENVTVRHCVFRENGLIGKIPVWFQGSITGSTLTTNPSATVNGSIAANSFVLTVNSVQQGILYPGLTIYGPGIPEGTIIIGYQASANSGYGETGTYAISRAPTAAVTNVTINAGLFDPITVGFNVGPTPTSIPPGPVITGTTITAINPPPAIGGILTSSALPTYTVSIPQNVPANTSLSVSDPNAIWIPKGNVADVMPYNINNVIIEDCDTFDGWGELEMWSMNFTNCEGVLMRNVNTSGLRSFGLLKGTYTANVKNMIVENYVSTNGTMYINPTRTKAGGNGSEAAKFTSSTSVTIKNSDFNGMYVKTQAPALTDGNYTANGITLNNNSQFLIENCNVQDMHNDGGRRFLVPNPTPIVPTTCGFSSQIGNSTLMRFKNCSVQFLNGWYGEVYGFGATNSTTSPGDMIYDNCTSDNFYLRGGAFFAAGYNLQGSRDQAIDSKANEILDQRLNPATGAPIASGLSTTVTTAIVALPVASIEVVSTAGFPSAGGLIVGANTATPQFVVYNGIDATHFLNTNSFLAYGGTGAVAVGAVVTPYSAFGVNLQRTQVNGATPASEANKCLVKTNILSNCAGAGIFDNTVAKNSTISGNFAQNNGSTGTGPNYLGINLLSNPVRDWVFPGPPSATNQFAFLDPVNDNMNVHL